MVEQELRYPKSHWENMTEGELSNFVLDIYDHYRKTGFPYYKLTLDEQKKELETMERYLNKNEILIFNTLKQTMHGLNVAWTYFPHAMNVKCGNMLTPLEAFEDDEKFKQVIRKRLIRGTYITDNGLRKELKTSTGIQAVSNFRPTSARALYDEFAGDGTVWDMSCGFGGRLLGAISSPRVKHYIGTEPETRTHKGLLEMARNLGNNKKIEIHNVGSEVFVPVEDTLDFCFTSPPYYDTEKYSYESTQSYVKYPEKEYWMNKFLMETISNYMIGLKAGGYLAINIANVKTYPSLTEDFICKMNEKFGGELKAVRLIKYNLSAIKKSMAHGEENHKTEPIFVYQKNL